MSGFYYVQITFKIIYIYNFLFNNTSNIISNMLCYQSMNSYNEMDTHENYNMPFQNVKFMKKGIWHCSPPVKFISLNCLMAWTNRHTDYTIEN